MALLFAATNIAAYAICAKPGLSTVTLPDGSSITIRLVGDEHAHYTLSEDNHLLLENEGFYQYATLTADGKIVASSVTAHDEWQRSAAERDFLSTIDDASLLQHLEAQQAARRRSRNADAGTVYPTTGNLHGLVILVEYDNVSFSIPDPQQAFYDMLNKEGYSDNNGTGSARDWFVDNSKGVFTPTFDVYGPVRLPHPRSYYGANGSSGDDANPSAMVTEACDLLDDEIDFSIYDADGDGFVDNVYIFYAGYGENYSGVPSECVWPHSDDIANITMQAFTHDGVRLNHYACSNEITSDNVMEGIGTFVHEFSHVLGLPDLYATNYSYAFTPGMYSVLDSGPYNNDSHTPPYYSAYERYCLGWLTPKEIGRAARHTLDEISTNQAFIITTENSNEYFILENRQQNGWDKYIPGHGMLIWHIDYKPAIWSTNTVNNKKSHQYVDIEEADDIQSDGTVDGDPFPGTGNVTSFTDYTSPSMKSWEGMEQNKPITEIKEDNGVISFAISGGVDGIDPVVANEATDVTMTSFTANWQESADATAYLLSVYTTTTAPSGKVTYDYINGFEKKNVGKATSMEITGLSAATEYKYSVRCYDSTTEMESFSSNEVSVVTLDPTFEYKAPMATAATAVSDSGFTANWEPLEEASGYILDVYTKSYGTPATDLADFTGGVSALPQGWDTNSKLTYASANYSGESAPSLRLSTEDSYIATPKYPEAIRSISFWHRGNSVSEGSKLSIRALLNGEWTELTEVDVDNGQGGVTTVITDNLAVTPSLPNGCNAVSITYEPADKGSVAIDDIRVEYGGVDALTYLPGYEHKDVGNQLNYQVETTQPGTYYYRVMGDNGANKSLYSNEIRVWNLSGVETVAVGRFSVTTDANTLRIVSDSEAAMQLFTPAGLKVADMRLHLGENDLTLTAGVYILRIGTQVSKIIIK
jgi:M6 family metalloprotease-like protein